MFLAKGRELSRLFPNLKEENHVCFLILCKKGSLSAVCWGKGENAAGGQRASLRSVCILRGRSNSFITVNP